MNEVEVNSALAAKYFREGLQQLDHLLIEERQAKEMILAAWVLGTSVVLIGEPGGGKTTLAQYSHRIFSDVSNQDVAIIPPNADLSVTHVAGATMETEKEINSEQGSRIEKLRTKVSPLVLPTTKQIWMEEINRTNPSALNGLLSALESGYLMTGNGKIVELEDYEMSIATMNPTESSRDGIFPIYRAIASRHSMGAILGANKNDQVEDDIVANIMLAGWKPRPQNVKPVTNTGIVHELRDMVQDVPIPNELGQHAIDIAKKTRAELDDKGIGEAAGRVASHLSDISRTLALLRGQARVNETDLHDAVSYLVTARVGMLAASTSVDASDVVNEIVNNSF